MDFIPGYLFNIYHFFSPLFLFDFFRPILDFQCFALSVIGNCSWCHLVWRLSFFSLTCWFLLMHQMGKETILWSRQRQEWQAKSERNKASFKPNESRCNWSRYCQGIANIATYIYISFVHAIWTCLFYTAKVVI